MRQMIHASYESQNLISDQAQGNRAHRDLTGDLGLALGFYAGTACAVRRPAAVVLPLSDARPAGRQGGCFLCQGR